MRFYFGDLYITEICVEGLELSYEFECGHCESSEFLLDFLTSHFNNVNLKFINMYYDAIIDNYIINLRTVNDKLISEPFDLSILTNKDKKSIESDLRICF